MVVIRKQDIFPSCHCISHPNRSRVNFFINAIYFVETQPNKQWWETMEDETRPFIMFGDMADFKPPQRREVLKSVKAAKTAPKKWKEYVFNDMLLKSHCPHADVIKNEYLKQMPVPGKWECTQTDHQTFSRASDTSRRMTTASVDIRNMGSILKMITSNGPLNTPKNTLLGARDSMEIASTTKLREKHRQTIEHGKVVLNIGNKVDSLFNEVYSEVEANQEEIEEPEPGPRETTSRMEDEEIVDESLSALGSIHNDSLQIIPSHIPDQDHKINYEKVCPMEKCQKLQVDSFIRSLPAYMRASPFTHVEQTYEEYEVCSPEQLEILKRRIEEKKKKEKVDFDVTEENPLLSWTPSLEGVAVQTSDMSISLPPCTCRDPNPTPASSTQKIYTVADLIPVKQNLDEIDAECFFNDNIEFNRFKVIGQGESREELSRKIKDLTKRRLQDIEKTLKQHPSLYEIFQANVRC
ncbi:unnamed protein product [Euphydryas editha]|uniref:Uncharacterized protein n=1 Tax=Euphydryas editha TaxID=104508 RepID=A0AAU9UD34_EUPED|nr:unnamed protein product [Euphydryas editha]